MSLKVLVAWLACGAFLTAIATEPAKEKPAAEKKTEEKKPDEKKDEKPVSLFDGKTLGKWKASDFATQGEVEVKDGNLVIGVGERCSGVTFKGDFPTSNYEIRLEAMRVDGSDFFCGLTFPVARPARADKKAETQPCTLVVGGWGGGVVGLSNIDGMNASENSTSQYKDFDAKKWYPIRVRVTEPKIEAWIGDDKVVDFTTTGHELSIHIEVEESKPLGIATFATTGAIRKIEYVKVTEPDSPPEKD